MSCDCGGIIGILRVVIWGCASPCRCGKFYPAHHRGGSGEHNILRIIVIIMVRLVDNFLFCRVLFEGGNELSDFGCGEYDGWI